MDGSQEGSIALQEPLESAPLAPAASEVDSSFGAAPAPAPSDPVADDLGVPSAPVEAMSPIESPSRRRRRSRASRDFGDDEAIVAARAAALEEDVASTIESRAADVDHSVAARIEEDSRGSGDDVRGSLQST